MTRVKDLFREIRHSFSRFFAIFMIVLLGVSFFLGVLASPFYMKVSADQYFDDYHLQDLMLISTIGFTEDDVEAVREVSGVLGASGVYTRDFLMKTEDMETDAVCSVTSIPTDLSDENDNFINRFRIFEGELPANENECIIRYTAAKEQPFHVGDVITVSTGTDEEISEVLSVSEFEISGIVYTPNSISFDLGSSNIGNGHISYLVYLPESVFLSDYYTEVLVNIEGAEDEDSFSDAYFDYVETYEEDFQILSEERLLVRMEEMKETLREEVSKEVEKEVRAEVEKEVRKKVTEEIENQTGDAVKEAVEEHLSDSVKTEVESKVKEELAERVRAEVTKEVRNRIHAAAEEELRKTVEAKVKEEVQKSVEEEARLQTEAIRSQVRTSLQNAAGGTFDALSLYLQERGYLSENWQENLESTVDNVTAVSVQYEVSLLMASDAVKARIAEETEKAVSEHRAEAYQAAENQYLQKYVDEAFPKAYEEAEKAYLSDTVDTYFEDAYTEAYDTYYEDSYTEAYEEALDTALSENLEDLVSENTEEQVQLVLPDTIEKVYKEQEESMLSSLPDLEWYILNRRFTLAFTEYENAVNTMKTISILFPIFFLFVAALVCFTTMTRMVDEQRMTIGTYKALGYGKKEIIMKYVMYALLSSLLGGVLGVFAGLAIYPRVIYNAWGIAYQLPEMAKADVRVLSILSVLAMVLVVVSSAVLACMKDLNSDPATLMRPKAPKLGKKIFLEYVPALWNRFSFTWKVTLRNIFRYKKRFIMTLLGVAGCTALLIVGFGLSDSIHHLIVTQYSDIIKYNAVVTMRSDISEKDMDHIKDFLSADDEIESLIYLSSENATVYQAKEREKTERVTMMAIGDMDALQEFFCIRDYRTLKKQELPDSGVLITKRLSDVLDLHVGDRISIENSDGKVKRVKVQGISEMYVGHYVFMSDKQYRRLYQEDPKENTAFMISSLSETEEEYLGSELMEKDGVSSVSFIKNNVKNINSMMSALNLITVVLVIASGLLAFVVLYNLANVNISERLREIATIKVLGFYDREVYIYVYRELIAITIFGALLGLPLGVLLHHIIMGAISITSIYFGHYISPLSFLYGFLLTVGFSFIVSLFIQIKLKKIPMVESLKSVE